MKNSDDFERFWAAYPRKVGKLAARKAFDVAIRRDGATLAQLLDGIAHYIRHKPSYADFAHPKTWLHQGRWLDEADAPLSRAPSTLNWLEECRRVHGNSCGLSKRLHDARMESEPTLDGWFHA